MNSKKINFIIIILTFLFFIGFLIAGLVFAFPKLKIDIRESGSGYFNAYVINESGRKIENVSLNIDVYIKGQKITTKNSDSSKPLVYDKELEDKEEYLFLQISKFNYPESEIYDVTTNIIRIPCANNYLIVAYMTIPVLITSIFFFVNSMMKLNKKKI